MNRLKQSAFFKSIFQLAIGSIIAQVIVIIISPFITRVYTVEEMGYYALLLTITSIFGSVINWKYDFAIITCEDDDLPSLLSLAVLVSVVSSFLVGLGLIIYFVYISKEGIFSISLIFLIVMLLVCIGFTNVLIAYNNRKKEYRLISNINVVRTTSQNLILLTFGFFKFGITGMVFSQIFGILFGIQKQLKSLKRDKLNININFTNNFNMLKKYIKFPLYSLPANLTNNLSYSILNFFISALYGLKILGFYSMTFRILGLPLSLVSANVAKVFFRDAIEEKNKDGQFTKTLLKSTLFLSIIAIPMVIILMILGPFLFQLVFGKGWYIAGIYARILAPMFGVRLVVSALTPSFIIANKQNLELYFQILFLISSLLTYIVSNIFLLDIIQFLIIYSIINTLAYMLLYSSIYVISRGEKIK